ncbi:MAG: hypothetical protein ACK46X_03310 [Candidatus Sericytochromatia bacterium]
MEQNKNWKQDMNDEAQSRGLDDSAESAQAPGRQTAASAETDFDQAVGDPNVDIKQFTNDVEYMDNRGPLGSGD